MGQPLVLSLLSLAKVSALDISVSRKLDIRVVQGSFFG